MSWSRQQGEEEEEEEGEEEGEEEEGAHSRGAGCEKLVEHKHKK